MKTRLLVYAALLCTLPLTIYNACSDGSSPSPSPTPSPTASPSPSSSPTPVTCNDDERTFKITNNTGEEIWLGVTAGTLSCLADSDCPTEAAGSCVGANPNAGVAGTCGCPTFSECGSVSTCNSHNHLCYWNLPSLSKSQIQLADGAESTVCFPAAASGKSIQWSGNIFARTGCDENGQNCKTGDCGASSEGICPTGTGGNPPTTLFEFTLSNQSSFDDNTSPDYYDISIINGINTALSGGPISGTFEADDSNPYSCTYPGSSEAQGSLSACSWTINPTVSNNDYSIWLHNVLPTAYTTCPGGGAPNSLGFCVCSDDSDCSSEGPYCGLALNASDQQYTHVCGTHLGWWTADQLCGSSINTASPLGAPLNCATTVNNSDMSVSSYTDFYACTKPAGASNPEQSQSCYTQGAAVDCCGCATSANADHTAWPSVLSPDFGGGDNGCYNNNPNWVTISQPWIVFLKQACPTAYTYPFDDATSTFTCEGSSSVGAPHYQLTFSPTH